LAAFFKEEMIFPEDRTDLQCKPSLGVPMIVTQMPQKIQNMIKWQQSLCSALQLFRSELKEKFYHRVLPHDI